MQNLHKPFLVAIAFSLAITPKVSAADDTTLPEVVVSGAAAKSEVMVSDPQPTPKSSVTKAGINLLGGPGQARPYDPLILMPSVIVESPDPYGLSPTGNINIRGKSNFHLTNDVQGLPLTGIVGGAYLFDLENIDQIDVYRGGLSANQGLGVSNASGAVDQQILGPQDTFSVLAKQSLGSFHFSRTFGRVDTGVLNSSGTAAFISGSTTTADKWKGAGDELRNNAMLGVTQKLGDQVKVDFDVVYDKYSGNSYRSLTYAQTQALSTNYNYDYNTSLTGKAATDVNYYNFNKVEYENYAALANIDVTMAQGQHLILKPYYWNDNGVQYSANGSNVQIWNQQNNNAGGVLEYQGRFGTSTNIVAGYWLESMEPPPPPTDQTLYTVTSNGGLAFAKWGTLAKIDNFIVNSPYVQATETLGQTVLSGGVRYMDLGAPKMQYFKTANLPDVSYDQIWAYNPAPDTNASVVAKDYRSFLPNIGIRENLNSEWSVSASYSRKFGRPDWGPQASNYISNESAFVAKNITLQSLVNLVKPELSDQIDISARYKSNGLTLVPTIFAAKNQNRQVQVVDPSLGGLSYYEGTAETTEYGTELEAEYIIDNSWSIFGSGTLASETYDQNTPTLSGGAVLATQGKQIPNAPNFMLKGGVSYRWYNLTLSPVLRYIGKRYGDSAETQPVAGYTAFDFNASYTFSHDILLKLSVLNLFNSHYIAEIVPNDTNLNGATAYYAGAPMTVAMTVSVKY
ncbi:MAG: TonB-dependent receptor [Desulfocapsaceae bacterium]|nr:TonB-dependent receptor [Desulfocapsaceae bacterium]